MYARFSSASCDNASFTHLDVRRKTSFAIASIKFLQVHEAHTDKMRLMETTSDNGKIIMHVK